MAVGTILVVAGAFPQGSALPRFEDYPVKEIFKGTPAAPKLVRPADKQFRTKIREGAAKGPNFAGHFTIAEWGCGSGCLSLAVVDAKDGSVGEAPFTHFAWGAPVMKYEGKYDSSREGFEPLGYKLNSRLLTVRGCPEEENCGSYFYEWTGSQFKLSRKVAAVPLQQ